VATDIYNEPPAERSSPAAGAGIEVPSELLIDEELSAMPFSEFMDKVKREARQARAEYVAELAHEQQIETVEGTEGVPSVEERTRPA
jgi:hypothetical protein